MFKNIKLWLGARGYLYLINAYTDAYLARQLVRYVKTGELARDSFFRQRLKSIIEVLDGAGDGRESLLIVAYTQYYWNGYYDYLMGKILLQGLRFFNFSDLDIIKDQANQYAQTLKVSSVYDDLDQNFVLQTVQLWLPLFKLLLGRFHKIAEFNHEYQVDLREFSSTQLAQWIMQTQKMNIKSNLAYVDKISNSDYRDKKLEAITSLMRQYPEQERFILEKSIFQTLQAASCWDRVFIKLIQIRF